MYGRSAFPPIVLLFLLSSAFFSVQGCPRHELHALFRFRLALNDTKGMLKSWKGSDCCAWRGVECYGTQEGRYVSKLDLSGNYFCGEIPSQLGNLFSLRHLDISSFGLCLKSSNLRWLSNLSSLEYLSLSAVEVNDKSWGSIIGSLLQLKHLDLSMCFWTFPDSPPIPSALLNLSYITFLDLSYNFFSNIPIWIDKLSSLIHLHLTGNNISGNIPNTIGKLSTLTLLDLADNNISGSIPNTIGNLSSLIYLDLSSNNISGSIPNTIGKLCYLTHFDLSYNNISDSIPNTIGKLSSLTYLDLSNNNNISGSIPNTIGNLSRLAYLDFSYNVLTGSLPLSFSQLFSVSVLDVSNNHLSGSLPLSFVRLYALTYLNLMNNNLNGSIHSTLMLPSSLQQLYLSNNSMNGAITEVLFQKSLKLVVLDLSQSGLSINISSTWIPSFHLWSLLLKECQIGGPIPSWISTQFSLSILDLSATQLIGNLPSWLWDIDDVYLSNNHLQGSFTPTSRSLRSLDLSMNELSGPLPADIHILLPKAEVLILADNKLEGQVPTSIANLTNLLFLDMSNNSLTGNVPASLGNLTSLGGLHLENNYLAGQIPKELGSLSDLRSLRIGKNSLQGVLHSSLRNLSSLQVLDVGDNNLIGNIPHWMANFSSLHVLVMRSNNFKGNLPPEIGQMPMLQVLDLSSNLFSGTIPHSYFKFPAMQDSSDDGRHLSIFSSDGIYSDGIDYMVDSKGGLLKDNYDPSDSIDLTIKGLPLHYKHILSSFTSFDLSNNRLTGHLLMEIENLKGLRYLNLSMNNLSGPIPKSLGNLMLLESVDLSFNQFSGQIPWELCNISYLAHLNFSFNQLYGKIPQQGGQMITFDESSFRGNPNLWGCPLEKNCSRPAVVASPPAVGVEGKKDEGFEFPWYWMCIGLSVGVGFSGVVLVLMFKHSWRTKCFQVMNRVIIKRSGAQGIT